MLPEDQNAQVLDQTPPATEPVEPQPIDAGKFLEELSEATRRGDADTVRRLTEQAGGEPAAPAAPAPAAGAPDPAAPPADVKKKFNVKYRGQPLEVDDPDHYLGHNNIGALKRHTILQEQRRKDLEVEFKSTMERLTSASGETENIKRERDEMKRQLEELRRTPAPAAPAPAPAQTPVEEDLVPPALPDLPEDALEYTDGDRKAYNKFLKDQAAFNLKIVAARNRPSAPVAATASPEFEALRAENAKLIRESEERARRDRESEAAETKRQQDEAVRASAEATWKVGSDFQALHKDLATAKPLQELHTEVVEWMDRVAEANGVIPPSFTATQVERNSYEQQRSLVVGAYLTGDKSVLESSEGITPPKEYRHYFDIADLYAYRTKMIEKGLVTPRTSLHQVWLYKVDQEGSLDQATTQLAADATRRGVNSALSAVSGAQRDFATNLPARASAPPPETVGTPSDEAKLLELAGSVEGMRQIYADPELKAKYTAFMSTYAN